jgi:leucyl/phenylalanyl-tRNA--protein transferase
MEPPPTRWAFPDPTTAPEDLVAVGADLRPGTVLAAYRSGLFPMQVSRRELGWWSPDPRGVVPLDGVKVSRSLRKSCARFVLRTDTAFRSVMVACAEGRRDGNWITPAFVDAYTDLHERGWTHSVEAYTPEGHLVGGLYGVAIGGLFAGESMFHRATDASKVALVGLVAHLRRGGFTLLDVQWVTPHLATLGAVPMARPDYLRNLAEALARPAAWPAVERIDDPLGG